MKIAVIGTGSVGSTLGQRWAELGHAVTFGANDPRNVKAKTLVAKIGHEVSLASVPEAVADAEVIVHATPATANADAIASAGELTGEILIDVTNPLKPDLSGLSVGPDTSGAESVAKLAPRARVFKALNQTGYENKADPVFPTGRAAMFVAGDDPAGKSVVLKLVGELGLRRSMPAISGRPSAGAPGDVVDPPDGSSEARPQICLRIASVRELRIVFCPAAVTSVGID